MVGENIKKYREEAGLTQAELAEKMGYEKTLILRWEHGTKEPFASQVKVIAEILNVDVAKLYE